MDGMSKLMARAGKGLSYKLPSHNDPNRDGEDSDEEGEEEEEKEDEKPFEPLMIWQSPHNGGECVGLPKQL